jgi:uncharacterized protein (TIGR03435 family)
MIQGASGGPGTRDPSLFRAQNFGLFALIQMAYDVEGYQISGPDWMLSTWFDISATVPAGATKEEFKLMLQRMLAERFGLKVHQEQTEAHGYELVVAKRGPRLTASAKTNDDTSLPKALPSFGPPTYDKNGFPVIAPGSGISKRGGIGGRTTARYTHETMRRFASELSFEVGGPVKDATGLKGEYDFMLRWVSSRSASDSDDPPGGPTVFEAVEKQLGLRLAPSKIRVTTLVIDHVEKTPTEN